METERNGERERERERRGPAPRIIFRIVLYQIV